MERDLNWFGDFPERRRSIGGKLANFIFCKNEHLTLLTASFLEELLADAGFVNIVACLVARETRSPNYFKDCLALEEDSDYECPHTIVMEALKP